MPDAVQNRLALYVHRHYIQQERFDRPMHEIFSLQGARGHKRRMLLLLLFQKRRGGKVPDSHAQELLALAFHKIERGLVGTDVLSILIHQEDGNHGFLEEHPVSPLAAPQRDFCRPTLGDLSLKRGVGLAQFCRALLDALLQRLTSLLALNRVQQRSGDQAAGGIVLVKKILHPTLDGFVSQYLVFPPGNKDHRHLRSVLAQDGSGLFRRAVWQFEVAEHHVEGLGPLQAR